MSELFYDDLSKEDEEYLNFTIIQNINSSQDDKNENHTSQDNKNLQDKESQYNEDDFEDVVKHTELKVNQLYVILINGIPEFYEENLATAITRVSLISKNLIKHLDNSNTKYYSNINYGYKKDNFSYGLDIFSRKRFIVLAYDKLEYNLRIKKVEKYNTDVL